MKKIESIKADARNLRLKMLTLLQDTIGEPVFPSNQEALSKWKEMCKYLPSRMFMIVADMKTEKIPLSHGFDLLGYGNGFPGTARDFLAIHHVNHQDIMTYQTYINYSILMEHPQLIKEKGLAFCTKKGIVDARGKAWLVHQVSEPFQYDKNDYVASYLSTYRIISEYDGEPFETNLYAGSKYGDEQEKLEKLLQDKKMRLLDLLGFSKTHKIVIENMALGRYSSKEIAEYLEISTKTLANHRQAILDRARELFPLNNFTTTQGFVEYLKKQRIV